MRTPSSHSGSELRIRTADPGGDAAACLAIYAPYIESGATSFEEEVPSVSDFGERIAETQRRYPWLVAESEREVLGFAYACSHRYRPSYRWAVEVSVYVGLEHRRKGFGRALYSELFARLLGQRFQVACAGITLPNEASVGLHESLGFTPVGVYRRIGWKDGGWRDVGWWQLELQPPTEGKPPEPLRP